LRLVHPARLVQSVAYHTGVLWVTPFVGMIDRSDLEYLLSFVMRDLAWLDVIIKGLVPGRDDVTRERLSQVRASLEAIAGLHAESSTKPIAEPVQAIRDPWDVPRGWTDYGAIRLALLASLPPSAWHSALAELRNMKPLVLPGSQTTWEKRVDDLDKQISDVEKALRGSDDKLKIWAQETAASIPHELQALWREIDFGRNHFRNRVAKQTTIARITWSLVLAATAAVTYYLSRWAPSDGNLVAPWFVALCGLLGGSVSALRSLGFTELPERGSLEIEAVKLRLRPIVGAMSAIVLYIVARSALVFEIVERIDPSTGTAPVRIQVGMGHVVWAYYALAFTAGFSERLFLGMLQAVGDKVSRASESPKPASHSSANVNSPPGQSTTK
jgi:hypothetical protein